MDMLSRYLYAVYNGLPKDSPRADIIAEISDALQSQIDEREAELGRPLTSDEEAAVLKAYGHPRIIAGRYAAVPYLIGPDFLPFYWYMLRLVLTIVIAVELLGGAVAAVSSGHMRVFIATLDAVWSSVVFICGGVTIVFALLERMRSKKTVLERIGVTRWDPRRLPAPPGSGRLKPVSRFSSIVEFVVNVIAILALLDIPGVRYWLLYVLVLGPLAGMHVAVQFNDAAWAPAYAGTLAGAAIIALIDIAAFVRPTITTIYCWTRIAANAVTLIGVVVTLARPPLVLAADSPFNELAIYVLLGAVTVLAIQIALGLVQLYRHSPVSAHAPAAWEKPT
jgi:hypothetical protein